MTFKESQDIALRIWERLGEITDHIIETKDQVSEVKDQVADMRVRLAEGESRMTRSDGRIRNLERQTKSVKPGTWTDIKGFLIQIATVKQWLTGAVIIYLAIEASRHPGELKVLMLKLLDGGLK